MPFCESNALIPVVNRPGMRRASLRRVDREETLEMVQRAQVMPKSPIPWINPFLTVDPAALPLEFNSTPRPVPLVKLQLVTGEPEQLTGPMMVNPFRSKVTRSAVALIAVVFSSGTLS